MSLAGRIAAVLSLALLLGLDAATAHSAQGFDPQGQGPGYPPAASGRSQSAPSVRAIRIQDQGIVLDGVLDDPVWQQGEAATGFKMHEPDRGAEPTEETVFKVAYDDDAIYFGVACYENDMSKVSSKLSRRDRIDQSDILSIYIDPYLDKTTAYNFRVNPHGVHADHYISRNGDQRDEDWDAVWDAEVTRDEHGWYAELRIPLSSIRYRQAEEMTWGLQIYRWMHGRGEDTGWACWDRETTGFVSRFGTLTGLGGISAPRQLEVTPYFVTRGTDPSNTGPEDFDNFQNVGADVKYGLTSDLTLNATIQPDFGQVEADPSVLNLSPFETFFEEKRPFFIEGAQFFQHPNFNLFYSRRIGTGGDDSRIRFATKLNGKTSGDISVAALVAATDITGSGQAHNLFRSGGQETNYFVTRFGKEFQDGAHRINVMQTGVVRPGTDRRNAYTTGVDFDMNLIDRAYNIRGSFVGSTVVPAQGEGIDPSGTIYGTGGSFSMGKYNGIYRGEVYGRWEGDQLLLNDIGFLSAPDEINGGLWLQRRFNGDGKTLVNQGNVNLNYFGSSLYAANQAFDPRDGSLLWAYDRFHHQSSGGNVNSWFQFRNYWSVWSGIWWDHEGTSRFETRGGPLMTRPVTNGYWLGGETDWRKDFHYAAELNLSHNVEGYRHVGFWNQVRWSQSTRISHRIESRFNLTHYDAQFISSRNFDNSFRSQFNSRNFDPAAIGGTGIGGTSYVFGELDTQTFDVTLRSDVLFTRDQSLEFYVQPFLSVGTFRNPRELVQEDTYDLQGVDLDASMADFNGASVNLNVVYRWQYRPGSTLFLVWTHSRNRSELRGRDGVFHDTLRPANLLDNEPENVFLAKFTYWFAI